MTTTDEPTGAPPDLEEAMAEGPPPEVKATEVAEPVEAQLPAVRTSRHGQQLIAGTDLAVVPPEAELAGLAQMAVTLSAAMGTVPQALRGKPNEVFMVLLTARDLGVGLTTAIREFHVIDGKVTISPKAKLALVNQQRVARVFPHQPPRRRLVKDAEGVERAMEELCECGGSEGKNDRTRALWHAIRYDNPTVVFSSEFTMEDADLVTTKEGGKSIKLHEKSNWKQWPARMLSWRAMGYLIDDCCPEVGAGLYSPDEMGAVTDEDGRVVIDVVANAEPLPGTNAPRGAGRSSGGGGQDEPETASPDDLAGIRHRIDHLGRHHADARKALAGAWVGDDREHPRLPPVGQLLAKQVGRAKAVLASIEGRAAKGEWGDGWEPPGDPPETPAESPQETPPGGSGPDGAPEPGSAGDGDPGANGATEDEDHGVAMDKIIEEVRAMSDHDVRAALDTMGKSRNGTDSTVRRRLAAWRAKDAGLIGATDAEVKKIMAEQDEDQEGGS